MQNPLQKGIAILILAAMILGFSPASAALGASSSSKSSSSQSSTKKSTPTVSKPKNQSQPNNNQPKNQNAQESAKGMSWPEILTLLAESLSPEQIQKFLEFISGMPYLLSEQQLQNLVTTLRQLSSNLTEEQIENLIKVLEKVAKKIENAENLPEIEEVIKKLQEFVDKNSLENNQATRNAARAMIMAIDLSIMTYANNLMITSLPASSLSEAEKALISTKLTEIHAAYQASWNRMNSLNTNDPASAQMIRSEISTMFYNPQHTSYFELTARPVLGAVQTLIIEPKLRQTLENLQTASETITQKIELIERTTGYADAARAQLLGIHYLVGRRNVTGMAHERLNTAVTMARRVLYENTTDHAALYAGYAINDMITGAQMIQKALHLTLNKDIDPGRNDRGRDNRGRR